MSLTEKEIRKVAKLARIGMTDEEIERLGQQVSGIIDWMEMLGEVDTAGIPQMTSVVEATLPMREDKVTDGGIQDQVLKNAPTSQYGFFVVPKVVE